MKTSTLCVPSLAIADKPEVSSLHVTSATGRHVACGKLHGLQLLLQDSDSADEIECSSQEDAASPACMQAATASTAKTLQQQHARVCTQTTYMSCQGILQLARNAVRAPKHALH